MLGTDHKPRGSSSCELRCKYHDSLTTTLAGNGASQPHAKPTKVKLTFIRRSAPVQKKMAVAWLQLWAGEFTKAWTLHIWFYPHSMERIANNLQFRRWHITLRLWNFSFISSHPPRLSDLSSRPFPFLFLVLFRLPMSPAEPASRVLGSLWFWDKVGGIWHEKNVVWTRGCGRSEEPVLEKGQVSKIGLEQIIEKVTDKRYDANDTVD